MTIDFLFCGREETSAPLGAAARLRRSACLPSRVCNYTAPLAKTGAKPSLPFWQHALQRFRQILPIEPGAILEGIVEGVSHQHHDP